MMWPVLHILRVIRAINSENLIVTNPGNTYTYTTYVLALKSSILEFSGLDIIGKRHHLNNKQLLNKNNNFFFLLHYWIQFYLMEGDRLLSCF